MSVPAQPDRNAAARRLNELRPQEHDNVNGQHVVSRVILKRFCDPASRLLLAVSVMYPNARTRLVGPGGAGLVKNFVPFASASAERLWAQTEDRLPGVLQLCDQGRVHSDPTAVDVLRDTLALHFVRNPTSLVVHERTYRQAWAEVTHRLPEYSDYEEAFRQHFSGLLPAGPEAAGLLLDQAARGFAHDYESGLLFRHMLERIFDKSRELLSSIPVEVIRPVVGEFLIGDSPVIVLDRHGRNGPVQGVALGDADQILMTLGPHTLIAFGPADATGVAPEGLVKELNALQIRAARERVFMRPGSGLGASVRSIRFGLT